jgi:HAD superfamily hydrolase (TIGR01549 family)
MVLSTVFFDFGGTLANSPTTIDRPWKVWAGVSRDFNLHLSEVRIQHALEAVDEEFGQQLYQYVGRTEQFWRAYDERILDRLRIRTHREEIRTAVETTFTDPSNVELFPETRAVLEGLRARGYRLGIISNFTDGLLKILEFHGLDRLLDTVTFSQEAGVAKPAPEIFATALGRARCNPSEAVHVGDSIPQDVEGAHRAGVQAVWLNRGGEPASIDCLTIHTLEELPHVLEVINRSDSHEG